jgi:hypothetical protein
MQRRVVKDTIPNLMLEIHMNSTSGQGVKFLPLSSMCIKGVPSPPDNVGVSLLSFQVPYYYVCQSTFLPTKIELFINF